jgi:hypothetical protein
VRGLARSTKNSNILPVAPDSSAASSVFHGVLFVSVFVHKVMLVCFEVGLCVEVLHCSDMLHRELLACLYSVRWSTASANHTQVTSYAKSC